MGRKRKLELNSSLAHTNESSNSSGISHSSLSIIQRSAANDRERTRMRVLSKAFVKLKTSLPWVPADTKLSKLDTLKLATSYISYLTRILQDDENKLNINTQDIFQTTSINFQKFNINTRLFSNIRFSSNEKQKKIIENLASNNNNTINANFGVIGNNGIHNMNMNFAAKNSMSFHQNEHNWPFECSAIGPIGEEASSVQIYIKNELTNPCYIDHQNHMYNNYGQSFT